MSGLALFLPPALASAVGGLLVLSALAGSGALLLAVIAAQVVLAYGGEASADRATAARDGALVVLAGAAGAIALAIEDNPTGLTPSLGPVAYVLGPAVLVALVLRLVPSASRVGLVEAFAAAVTGIAVAGMLATLVETASLSGGDRLVALTVGCATLGALPGIPLDGLRRPAARWGWWVAKVVALALAAGLAVSDLAGLVDVVDVDDELRWSVGAAATVAGVLGAEVAVRLVSDRIARAALVPTLAIALAAVPSYVLARVLLS
jgi:hypothetical protein